jgi:hypothetical protein
MYRLRYQSARVIGRRIVIYQSSCHYRNVTRGSEGTLSETVPFSDVQDPAKQNFNKMRDAFNMRDLGMGGLPFVQRVPHGIAISLQ